MILNKLKPDKDGEITYNCVWTAGERNIRKKYYNTNFPMCWMDFFDSPNEAVYYVEYMGIDTFKLYTLEEYVDSEFINAIRDKNNNTKLVLHLTGHGYHEVVKEVYDHVIGRDRVPAEKIILSSESLDLHTAMLWVSKKYNYPPLKVKVTFEFQIYGQQNAKDMTIHIKGNEKIPILPFNFEQKKYDKKFLCLNGYWRQHRAAIVFLLESLGLLDKGIISYNIKNCHFDTSGIETYKMLYDCTNHHPEIKQLLELNKDKLCKIDNILLDTEYNQDKENLANIKNLHNDWFNQTYFSIVTETNFPAFYPQDAKFSKDFMKDNVGRLYSEKIFRTIVYKHPFLATGPKHFLKGLKWLGYKTFHPYIDESYDEESDDVKRLLMIVKEAKRLSEFTDDELAKFLAATKEICEYNFELIKKQKTFVFDLPISELPSPVSRNKGIVRVAHILNTPP
jgi:hypothetical protein